MIKKNKGGAMQEIPKYENLHELLPELLPVLQESVQCEILEIGKIDKESEKFQMVHDRFPILDKAVYVIYSKFIKKCEHEYETFIFLDEKGKSIAHISGRELTLHGILKPCEEFSISEEYLYNEEE
jgi:hypothetical protein